MSKNSATEKVLGDLHSKVATVFQKVLTRYEARLDVFEAGVSPEDMTDDVLSELLSDGAMPNPAMLAAITKFLKDNSIAFDTEEVDALNDQERRLAERRNNRKGVGSLAHLALVSNV